MYSSVPSKPFRNEFVIGQLFAMISFEGLFEDIITRTSLESRAISMRSSNRRVVTHGDPTGSYPWDCGCRLTYALSALGLVQEV
jgi:hypothetical protein